MRFKHRTAALPTEEIERQVELHRAETAAMWSETSQDMAIGDHVRAFEEMERTRQSIIIVALLVVVIALVGAIWTVSMLRPDRIMASDHVTTAPNTTYGSGGAR